MDTISILNTTLDAALDYLADQLITNVGGPDDSSTVPFTVKEGRLQADPTQGTGLSIMLYANSPYYEDDWHVHAAPQYGVQFPQWEIGGGTQLWRSYLVEIGLFNLNQTVRAVTRHTAMVVLSRLEDALWRFPVGHLPPDSFGERPIMLVVNRSTMREGGGDTAFIWRGFVGFRTLNARPTPG